MCDTLVADADRVYHPGLFDDRLLLGLKGIMSEAESYVLRARLSGAIRAKAARGELRRGLPVGLVYHDDGQIGFHPDEAVTGVIAAVFEQFAIRGSARAVWLWLCEQGLQWPLQQVARTHGPLPEITWVQPSYKTVLATLRHPAYAGAYVYGRTRQERFADEHGQLRLRRRDLPPGQWEVLLPGHHRGFIGWGTYQDIQQQLAGNIRPRAGAAGTGAVREGAALLQGLATCGICGRGCAVYYDRKAAPAPGYYCTGGQPGASRGRWHLRVGGIGIDSVVAEAFLTALVPAAIQACLAAADQIGSLRDAALDQHRRQAERARYQARQAERRYRAVDPDNRLVARGLEAEWEHALQEAADAEADLARREEQRPVPLAAADRDQILRLAGQDLHPVWNAPTTTDKDRKQLLRTLITDVAITVHRDGTEPRADLLIRWKGGATSDLTLPLKRQPPVNRTSEDTISLIRRLAAHYPDDMIAQILGKQGRATATGLSYTAGRVQSIRHHWGIPRHQPAAGTLEGELVTVAEAARQLGLAPSTMHRWLADGFIAGEQITPGAPWQIRMTAQLRSLFTDTAPAGWLTVREATSAHGVSRQTLMQRVKRGDLPAVHVRTGRAKGLRIPPPAVQDSLF